MSGWKLKVVLKVNNLSLGFMCDYLSQSEYTARITLKQEKKADCTIPSCFLSLFLEWQ